MTLRVRWSKGVCKTFIQARQIAVTSCDGIVTGIQIEPSALRSAPYRIIKNLNKTAVAATVINA